MIYLVLRCKTLELNLKAINREKQMKNLITDQTIATLKDIDLGDIQDTRKAIGEQKANAIFDTIIQTLRDSKNNYKCTLTHIVGKEEMNCYGEGGTPEIAQSRALNLLYDITRTPDVAMKIIRMKLESI
jgi:hypothetical protein